MLTASRALWTLARDGAAPFPDSLGHVSRRWRTPATAIVAVGGFCTLMGLVYLGSDTAFQALVGSFVVLLALSFLAAVVPRLVCPSAAVVEPGPFHLGQGWLGILVRGITCAFLSVWVVFYCFPYTAPPVGPADMNYSSLIVGGLTILVAIRYWWVRKTYEGSTVHTRVAARADATAIHERPGT